MWKVLANKYRDDFAFANYRDRNGQLSVTLGHVAGTQKESKILIYLVGLAKPLLFEGAYSPSSYILMPPCNAHLHPGVPKYRSISTFFDSILDGTANLTGPNAHQPEEERIDQRGHGTDFHGSHDYIASPSNSPKVDKTWERDNGEENTNEREENPIYRAIRIQLEMEGKDAMDAPGESIPSSSDTDQDVLELHTTSSSKAVPQASEMCSSERVTDGAAPSCASPIVEEALPTHEGISTPEAGHVKDEL
jgi:protein disulfide-isomerase A6